MSSSSPDHSFVNRNGNNNSSAPSLLVSGPLNSPLSQQQQQPRTPTLGSPRSFRRGASFNKTNNNNSNSLEASGGTALPFESSTRRRSFLSTSANNNNNRPSTRRPSTTNNLSPTKRTPNYQNRSRGRGTGNQRQKKKQPNDSGSGLFSVIESGEFEVDEDGMIFELSTRPEDFPQELIDQARGVSTSPARKSGSPNQSIRSNQKQRSKSGSMSRSASGSFSSSSSGFSSSGSIHSSMSSSTRKRKLQESPTTAFLQVLVEEDVMENEEQLLWCASRGTQCELMSFTNKVRRRSSFDGIVDVTPQKPMKTVSVFSRAKAVITGNLATPRGNVNNSNNNSRATSVGSTTSHQQQPHEVPSDAADPPPPHCANDEVYCVPLGDYRAKRAQLLERDDETDDSGYDTQSDDDNESNDDKNSDEERGNFSNTNNSSYGSLTSAPGVSGGGGIRIRRKVNSSPSPSESPPLSRTNSMQSATAAATTRRNNNNKKNTRSPTKKKRRSKSPTTARVETIKHVHHHHTPHTGKVQRIGPNAFSTGLAQGQMYNATHPTAASSASHQQQQQQTPTLKPSGLVRTTSTTTSLSATTCQNINTTASATDYSAYRKKLRDKVTMTEIRSVFKVTKFREPTPPLPEEPEYDSTTVMMTNQTENQQALSDFTFGGGGGNTNNNNNTTANNRRKSQTNNERRRQSALMGGSSSLRHESGAKDKDKVQKSKRGNSLNSSVNAESKVAINSRFSIASPVSRRKSSTTGEGASMNNKKQQKSSSETTTTTVKGGKKKGGKSSEGNNLSSSANNNKMNSNNNNNNNNNLAIEYYEGIGIILRPLAGTGFPTNPNATASGIASSSSPIVTNMVSPNKVSVLTPNSNTQHIQPPTTLQHQHHRNTTDHQNQHQPTTTPTTTSSAKIPDKMADTLPLGATPNFSPVTMENGDRGNGATNQNQGRGAGGDERSPGAAGELNDFFSSMNNNNASPFSTPAPKKTSPSSSINKKSGGGGTLNLPSIAKPYEVEERTIPKLDHRHQRQYGTAQMRSFSAKEHLEKSLAVLSPGGAGNNNSSTTSRDQRRRSSNHHHHHHHHKKKHHHRHHHHHQDNENENENTMTSNKNNEALFALHHDDDATTKKSTSGGGGSGHHHVKDGSTSCILPKGHFATPGTHHENDATSKKPHSTNSSTSNPLKSVNSGLLSLHHDNNNNSKKLSDKSEEDLFRQSALLRVGSERKSNNASTSKDIGLMFASTNLNKNNIFGGATKSSKTGKATVARRNMFERSLKESEKTEKEFNSLFPDWPSNVGDLKQIENNKSATEHPIANKSSATENNDKDGKKPSAKKKVGLKK